MKRTANLLTILALAALLGAVAACGEPNAVPLTPTATGATPTTLAPRGATPTRTAPHGAAIVPLERSKA